MIAQMPHTIHMNHVFACAALEPNWIEASVFKATKWKWKGILIQKLKVQKKGGRGGGHELKEVEKLK